MTPTILYLVALLHVSGDVTLNRSQGFYSSLDGPRGCVAASQSMEKNFGAEWHAQCVSFTCLTTKQKRQLIQPYAVDCSTLIAKR